jgi:signal transduction histidine kinase
MSRALAPLLAAALGLAGSLAATLFLFRAAEGALDRVLDERLRGAGESAALLLSGGTVSEGRLHELMKVNALDGASLIDRSLVMIADGSGRSGQRVDLLRVDADRVQQAFAGADSVGPGYSLGELTVTTGYFPVRAADGSVTAVLFFEGGQSFLAAQRDLSRARIAAVVLSLLAAIGLGVVAARWSAAERVRHKAAEQAARGDSMTRMAAMVAHEIRNPLGVMRGTVELMRERVGSDLPAWQGERFDDLLGEVERLRRLTDDFLSLGKPPPLATATVDLSEVLSEAARAAEATFREVKVSCRFSPLPPITGDPGRLRQVFANLLANASQAQERGEIELSAAADDGVAQVRVHDSGPGMPPAVRERLFDPFVTTKAGGTGLGLAVAQMIVKGHGGTLSLVDDGRPGTTFEVRLPLAGA